MESSNDPLVWISPVESRIFKLNKDFLFAVQAKCRLNLKGIKPVVSVLIFVKHLQKVLTINQVSKFKPVLKSENNVFAITTKLHV